MPSNGEQDGAFSINGQKYVVPAEIDGITVPPDPGSDGYDTLLGIDSNDNGVRDDVERYIYARFNGYKHANKERAIAMQYGRVVQKLLADGPGKAMASQKLMSNAGECEHYFEEQFLGYELSKGHDTFDANFKDVVFNTRERLYLYFDYNAALSGHAFAVQIFPRLSTCDIDITQIKN